MARQGSLLDVESPIEGVRFQEEFITRDAELALVERIQSLEPAATCERRMGTPTSSQPFFRFGLAPPPGRCSVSAAAASKSHDGAHTP